MAEFDLIARIRARAGHQGSGEGVVLGIGDDAALLQVPPLHELVVTADTLNAGVHFPRDATPEDIGWKALAVNLSDLAAMGARAAWCTLSLSLPHEDAAWVDGFIDGFLELAGGHGIALVGGDTTRGPLSIAVTAFGLVETGTALRRDRACMGDDVWVTGTLGDAAAALALAGHVPWPGNATGPGRNVPDGASQDPAAAGWLAARLARPSPRLEAGRRLRALAHACVDVSDGLLADLGHVCGRSAVGAEVDVDALPASAALRTLCGIQSPGGPPRPAAAGPALEVLRTWQASGGDDYELCFTAAPALREAVGDELRTIGMEATRIGRIVAGTGVRAHTADGTPWTAPRGGYVHFG